MPDTLDVVEPASDYRALIETDRREPEPHLNHFGATLYPWSWDKNATDHPPSLRNVSPLSDASPLSSAPSLSSCPSLSSGTSLRSRPSSYSACSISSGSSWSRLDSGLGSERNSWDGGPGPKVLRYEADKPVHQQQQQGRAVFIEDNATSRGKPDANGESRLAYVRPTPSRILCPRCNDYPEGFRGAHEFRRHMDRAHVTKPKVWITVDISPEKTFLAKCKACVTGKKYRAYSSAAAHLRRVHFIPRKRGRGAETNERRGMTGNNHPPMDILRMWLKKVEDVIGEAPVMAQPGGLDLEVSKQTRESPEHMDELGITRRTGSPSQRGTFPIINSFVGDFQEGFPEETYHGYYGGVGAPWQDSPNLYMDQHHEQNYGTGLVIPWAQQPMITSPYCSDSPVEFDKQRKSTVQPDAGESGNCDSTGPPKVGEAKSSSQKIIKKEIFDQDIYMKSDSPNSTCDDSNIKKEKMRSFKTLDEQQDLQELKGIDEKGVFAKEDPSSSSKDNQKPYPEDIKASVSPHYAAHQLAKKIENVDKGYQKYLREPDRSEILPNVLAAGQQADIDYEKKYARFMFEAFHHWTMTESKYMPSTKSGPELGTSSSSLGTQSKPLISFYVGKGNHSKHRDTLPLPFGHPKSGQWTQMLPLIKACTKDIMGKGNGGALELFVLDGEPTICVTCWDPSKLNLALLKKCMEPLGLGISVAKGKVRRSAGNEHDESGDQGILGDRPWSLPSIHGHYMAQPTCGASLGTSEGPFKDGKVSLGGYLKIKHLHRGEWSYYAMTVHHVLVDSKHKQSCSPNMNGCEDVGEDEDQEMADAGYDTSPGVCNGVYSVGEDSMKKIMFSSPAVLDGKDLVSRLENRRIMRRANEDYASIDSLDNLDTVLHAVGTSDSTMFGSAAWSSGLCLDQDVEVCLLDLSTEITLTRYLRWTGS